MPLRHEPLRNRSDLGCVVLAPGVHHEGIVDRDADDLVHALLGKQVLGADEARHMRGMAGGRERARHGEDHDLAAIGFRGKLDRFRPFHIARALTLSELGDDRGAAIAYRRALELPGNGAEDDYLADALSGLDV